MNGEALTILNPWLFVRIFSDYGCLNTEKSVLLTDIDFQSFVEAVEKPKYEEKKPKVTNSATLIMAFLAAENENRQLEDLPQAAFGCVPERHLLLVRTELITENFVY